MTRLRFVVLGLAKKGDSRALSGFIVVDLTLDSTLILGCHHSYNKALATVQIFSHWLTDAGCAASMGHQRTVTWEQGIGF